MAAWSYETIRQKYLANYITDEQLARFVTLGAITQEQYDQLWTEKHGENVENAPAETETETE